MKRKSIFQTKQDYVKRLEKKCDDVISKSEGVECIHVKHSRKSYQLYTYIDGKEIYLNHKNITDNNKKSIELYCALYIKKAICKAAKKCSHTEILTCIDTAMSKLKAKFGNLIPDFVKTREDYCRTWETAAYEGNDLFSEKKIHLTKKGEKVRSKSEMMIADYLHEHNIPYRYEASLQLHIKVIYPDFTIVNPYTGEIFYLEHFGMLDNPDYANDMVKKIDAYLEAGYVPGFNLLFTYETKDEPFNLRRLVGMIDECILNKV